MKFFICLFTCLLPLTATAMVSKTIDLSNSCSVRVVSSSPMSPKADVLFLHGFADRADNHGPLFSKIVSAGYRVISFDYPSHGETNCGKLNYKNFSNLFRLSEKVLAHPDYISDRPLFLTGWSTGGLLAYRMAQEERFPSRTVHGLILLAPGFYVYKIPGDNGKVTLETLVSNPNPPHKGPIKPTNPLKLPFFSSTLLANSLFARQQKFPDIPVLMILAGDNKDVYVQSKKIKKWYNKHKHKKIDFLATQCPGAKHELDNEVSPIGKSVRNLFVDFLTSSRLDKSNLATCPQL